MAEDFGGSLAVGSSIGWTDEKHMLYLASLEESFISQIYEGEHNLDVVHRSSAIRYNLTHSPRAGGKNFRPDENNVLHHGCWRKLKFDRAKTRKSLFIHSKSLFNSKDLQHRIPCFVDDNASINQPIQEEASARETRSMKSPARHLKKHQHCICRRTEVTDQNFVGEEIEGNPESSTACKKKRLRSLAANTPNDQVVRCGKPRLVDEGCGYRKEKGDHNSDGSSEFETGLGNKTLHCHSKIRCQMGENSG